MQKVVFVEDLGEVKIEKKTGIRNLRLSVHPKYGINIVMPSHAKYEEALDFLRKKKNWVKKKIDNFAHIKPDNFVIQNGYVFAETEVKIIEHESSVLKAKYEKGVLNIFIPNKLDLKSVEVQNFIKKAIEMVLKNKALDFIPKKLEELSKIYSLNYNSIKIGNSRTRWGSCDSFNKLTFSCYLMLLSEDLIEFVIIHELSHTIHKNHGKEFHDLVNKLCLGKEKELNKKLKSQRHLLMYK